MQVVVQSLLAPVALPIPVDKAQPGAEQARHDLRWGVGAGMQCACKTGIRYCLCVGVTRLEFSVVARLQFGFVYHGPRRCRPAARPHTRRWARRCTCSNCKGKAVVMLGVEVAVIVRGKRL